ncbi:hypothetical protein GCM10020220_044840 [Nonomuraea rubra]
MRPAIRTRRLVTVLLAVLAAYFLMPLYWLVVAATKSTGDLINSSPLWFANPQLFTNLGELFSFGGGIFWRWVLNSVVYAGVGALGATLISACAGYALAKCAFRGREALFNVILAGVLLPMTALGLPLFLLMSKLGLANTYWAGPAAQPGQPVRGVPVAGLRRHRAGRRARRGPLRRRRGVAHLREDRAADHVAGPGDDLPVSSSWPSGTTTSCPW